MTVEAFASAFVDSVFKRFPVENVSIVVRSEEDAAIIKAMLDAHD